LGIHVRVEVEEQKELKNCKIVAKSFISLFFELFGTIGMRRESCVGASEFETTRDFEVIRKMMCATLQQSRALRMLSHSR